MEEDDYIDLIMKTEEGEILFFKSKQSYFILF